jgi:hypothetical protein
MGNLGPWDGELRKTQRRREVVTTRCGTSGSRCSRKRYLPLELYIGRHVARGARASRRPHARPAMAACRPSCASPEPAPTDRAASCFWHAETYAAGSGAGGASNSCRTTYCHVLGTHRAPCWGTDWARIVARYLDRCCGAPPTMLFCRGLACDWGAASLVEIRRLAIVGIKSITCSG